MITTRPELRGDYGMVASTQWLASSVGMSVLERGGNAFDAAVAAGLVLQVVEPHLNGPGGEVPIILYSSAARRVFVINGQGPAPRAATITRFQELGLNLVPGTGLLTRREPGGDVRAEGGITAGQRHNGPGAERLDGLANGRVCRETALNARGSDA